MACNKSLQNSLAWCQGQPSLPGIKRRIYYISKNFIVSWPTYTEEDMKVKSPVLNGKFTLAADAKWKYIDVLQDKCQVTSEAQGEYPSQTQLNKLVAVHPGVGIQATMLASYVNNDDCIFLVETMDGMFRLIGSEAYQSKCTVAQDLGQGPTGSTSTTLNVEVTDFIPAPFYYGEIVTADGNVAYSQQYNGSLTDDEEEDGTA